VALLTAATLAGTPAVVGACLALCVPGLAAGAARSTGTPAASHVVHGARHEPPEPISHSHHHETAPSEEALSSTPPALDALDRGCCEDTATAPLASLTAARAMPAPPTTAVAGPPGQPRVPLLARIVDSRAGPPVEPPRPVRTAAILRI
jgi:hypothetical protein